VTSQPVNERLRRLPSVAALLDAPPARRALEVHPRAWVVDAAQAAIADVREALSRDGDEGRERADLLGDALAGFAAHLARLTTPGFRRVINATGVVVHTNLGRSPIAASVMRHVAALASSYGNLEYDLAAGERGSRHALVTGLLTRLTGAEAACVVNNNAAAVFLALAALAAGREVVVSRGQLVEIGGSFRIPEILAASGARLVEVGTTNKTHARDYEAATGPDTALLLKVHSSNFRILGFTAEVALPDLVAIGRRCEVPVMEDLGSGCFVPPADLGLGAEPTVQDAVAAGADLVTFSGDKMLGGPQAGIVVGRADLVARIRTHPLMRMVRPDKMTLAALEGTLRQYADPERALAEVPTLAMLRRTREELDAAARALVDAIGAAASAADLGGRLEVTVRDGFSRVGGGAMPLADLPTRLVAVRDAARSADALARAMRAGDPPVVGRIEDDRFLIDPRTLRPGEDTEVAARLVEEARR
jgi:L-seryl-tRNA(Ser) seleniumtransferase